jgi:hypothetical protein
VRLLHELRERGYAGGVTQFNDFLRAVRPPVVAPFEVRFETPAGRQAQVDFAHFMVEFTEQPGVQHRVWLFAMVLGHSRYLWAQYVLHQDLGTVLRCHMLASWPKVNGHRSPLCQTRSAPSSALAYPDTPAALRSASSFGPMRNDLLRSRSPLARRSDGPERPSSRATAGDLEPRG